MRRLFPRGGFVAYVGRPLTATAAWEEHTIGAAVVPGRRAGLVFALVRSLLPPVLMPRSLTTFRMDTPWSVALFFESHAFVSQCLSTN